MIIIWLIMEVSRNKMGWCGGLKGKQLAVVGATKKKKGLLCEKFQRRFLVPVRLWLVS